MGFDHSGHMEVEDMPANADEMGSKLMSILDMFGRELLRTKVNESMHLRTEAKEAKEAAQALSTSKESSLKAFKESGFKAFSEMNDNKGAARQTFTRTWFNSPVEAQTTLRELKQISPQLFANATIIGHFLVHPKDKKGSRVIENTIDEITRDHRIVNYVPNVNQLEKGKSGKAYLDSKKDGNCTRFSFGKYGDEGASFNAAYYCSVLQDYDINARHIANQIILDNADVDRALNALNLEKSKVEAMGPERGEMFMRQRFMDRIGVEYEPPVIEGEAEGYGDTDGDFGTEAPMPDVAHNHEDDDREFDDGGVYVPSLDDIVESRGVESVAESSTDGKAGPESTEQIAEEELAEKTVESSPTARPESELGTGDADEILSRETRKAELHEDISNSKTTADCVQARPDAHNGDLSTPYADGQDAPGTGDSDGDGIRDAAEDRDGDGTPDSRDQDTEYIDDDPDYEPVSMKERTVDELMSDKGEEASFVASRSAAQAEKDVSLETVNR